jgi:hypothetical protein
LIQTDPVDIDRLIVLLRKGVYLPQLDDRLLVLAQIVSLLELSKRPWEIPQPHEALPEREMDFPIALRDLFKRLICHFHAGLIPAKEKSQGCCSKKLTDFC